MVGRAVRDARGASFRRLGIDALVVEDEASFRHVGVYEDLVEVLRRARYTFRVLPRSRASRWDRALLLNLTFWDPQSGGDVLVDARVPADVVAHAAWHHLAAKALGRRGKRLSAEALFLGEAIASAFDVYLVGRLLGHAPRSSFLETQVPALAEAAASAGMSEVGFARMLARIARDPERAFADLRELLSDATAALYAAGGAEDALRALAALDDRPFAPLLHHYELSSWVLYARAYGAPGRDAAAVEVDRALRSAESAIDWLTEEWVVPAISRR